MDRCNGTCSHRRQAGGHGTTPALQGAEIMSIVGVVGLRTTGTEIARRLMGIGYELAELNRTSHAGPRDGAETR
jgi:hypothetical protein